MTVQLPTRNLEPMSVFFLSTRSVQAARLLSNRHITSQCRALGQVMVQIARDAGLDVSELPRREGPYDETELLTAGMWATESSLNYRWFVNYTGEVFAQYRWRFGQKRFDAGKKAQPEHASQGYCEWCWEQMQEQGITPAWRSEGFTAPPVPGVGDDLTVDAPQNMETWKQVAEMSYRLYQGFSPVPPDQLEEALLRLGAAVTAHPRSMEWMEGLLERPALLALMHVNHPVVKAWKAAHNAGAHLDAIRACVRSHPAPALKQAA